MGFNNATIMGRLTRDPDFRTTQSGVDLCRFSVAVDRYTKPGEEKKADFIDCVAWKNTAQMVSRYFTKGRMILVNGSIQNNNYTDNNGVKHYACVLNVQSVSFCGDKSGTQGQPDYKPSQEAVPQASPAPQQAAQQSLDVSDLGDFEEILSDGEVPF